MFGGTFDPPHIGHLLVAQTIFEAENYDKIVFIPTFKTPQKNNITDIKDRLAMLRMGVTSNPNFEISDLEIQRGGTSYTIDTVREYKSDQDYDSRELYYLIGSDSLQTFHTWKEPREVLDECQVIVAKGQGFVQAIYQIGYYVRCDLPVSHDLKYLPQRSGRAGRKIKQFATW